MQTFDREGSHIRDVNGFDRPAAAVLLADLSLVVAEPFSGRLLSVKDDERRVIIDGLNYPAAIEDAGNGSVLVADSGSGDLLRVATADGAVTTLARDLGRCRSISVAVDGTTFVLDAAGGRVLAISPADGQVTPIADGLPVGYLAEPYARSGGIAVGGDGSIYVAADVENAIYRIVPPTHSE